MRTALIIVGGLVLWTAIVGIARLTAGEGRPTPATTTTAFVVLWVAVAAANMAMGIVRAGYTWREELPIFLVITAIPVAVAWATRRFL
jgi:hypothetical protein